MTQQIINIGTAPNAGDGDPLRTSFTKTNENFTELYGYSADLSGVSNVTQARSNLGLGGMATQGASAVSITGGAVDGTPVGAMVASSGAFSSLDVNGISYPTVDGIAGQVLKTDGQGVLSFGDLGTMSTQNANSVAIVGGNVDGVSIGASTPASGAFTTLSSNSQAMLSGLAYPAVDGASGQVIATDGAGNLSFVNNAGGLGAVVDDPSPELGGDLNVNGHAIVTSSDGDIVLAPDGSGEIKAASTINAQDNVLEGAQFRDYSESVVTIPSSGASQALDFSEANVFDLTLTENCTLSIANAPLSGKSGSITLILRQDGSGNRTVAWPVDTLWSGGAAPTLSAAASAIDVVTMFTVDGGGVWFGFAAGLAMS